MKLKLNNGDEISMCYCDVCKQGGGKFQLTDKKNKKNKKIYIKSGNDIAELIKNGRNK